ncbi:hypothetical protein DER45DRAFT_612482 [Fusarium avenaceum]|nr:hypothetical protein DER45DRAFT_612482 [Fusarium avenaceum]
MPPEASAQNTIAIDPNFPAPKNPQTQSNNVSPLPSSTAARAAAPAPQNTRSSWRAGSAMFDIQMNPYNAPGRETTSTSHAPPRVSAPLPSLGLITYHDGRIRNAVPSKLKGKTNRKQGNFGVMQMHVQKPEMTERDLAAKRTSEGTAAAARLASAQRYVQPRRPRPQPVVTYPPPQIHHPIAVPVPHVSVPAAPPTPVARPPQARSQPAPILPAAPRPIPQPPHLASAEPQDKSLTSRTGAVEVIQYTNLEQTNDTFTDADDIQEISAGHADAPFADLEDTQDVEMEQADEPPMAAELVEGVDMPRNANAEQTASSANKPTHMLPIDAKIEQARLLKLLQSIPPVSVVNQLCRAIVHFGGTPSAPPPTDGYFPQSVSSNGSGDLFISWLSEVFPSTLALSEPAIPESITQPKSLARSRGRPKGSKNSSTTRATHTVSTTFVPLTIPSNGVGTVVMQPPPAENDTSAAQKPAANSQNSDASPLPTTNAPSQTSTVLPATLRPLLPLPAQPIRPVAPSIPKIKRMRRLQILPGRKPTGRPRGRPKGSKNKSRPHSGAQNEETDRPGSHPKDSNDTSISRSAAQADGMGQSRTGPYNTPGALSKTTSRGTISATHEVASGLPHSTKDIRTEAVTGNAIAVNNQPQVPKSNQQGAGQTSPGKRKESQQTVHSDTQALDTTQFCGATATPVDSDSQAQQVKRRRMSQETVQGYLTTGNTGFYSADTVTTAFPEAVVARQLHSASSNLDSQAQRRPSTSGGGSELWQQPVTSQSYQQNILRSSQSQTPDMSLEQASHAPHMPSPAVNRPRNQLQEAPDHISTDMTATSTAC